MTEKVKMTLAVIIALISGFGIAQVSPEYLESAKNSPPKITIPPVVKFKKIEGDLLFLEIYGGVKVVWPGQHVVKDQALVKIPIGQIPDENDLEFRKFLYVGNAKTKKFYPSYTYPARGTAVKDRRFFATKEKALEAGFIASKLVK